MIYRLNCVLIFSLLFSGVIYGQLGKLGIGNERWLSDSTQLVMSEGQQLILSRSGDTLLQMNYESCKPFRTNLRDWYLVVQEDGKTGLINLEQEIVIPFQFAGIAYHAFGTNYVHVSDEEGRNGIWSLAGKEVLPPQYYMLSVEANGLFTATDFDTRLAGVVDTLGQIRLPFEYQKSDVLKKSNLLIAGVKGGKKALFDAQGEQLTDFEYWAFKWDERLPEIVFAKDYAQQYALLDTRGKQLPVHPVDWYAITPHSICVRIDQDCGFLSLSGEYITGFDYRYVSSLYSDARQRVLAKRLGVEAPEYLVGKGLRGDTMYIVSNTGREYVDPDSKHGQQTATAAPKVSNAQSSDKLPVIENPATPAQFPGGNTALMSFISTHLEYPEIAKENNIEGMVVMAFTVEEDGRLSHIDILRDIGNACGQAAQRMVGKMPKWTPAQDEGKPVRSRVTLPVRFVLTN